MAESFLPQMFPLLLIFLYEKHPLKSSQELQDSQNMKTQ